MLKARNRIQNMSGATPTSGHQSHLQHNPESSLSRTHGWTTQQLSHVQLIPQLINSLADEKVRWQDTVESLDDKINNSSGDVLVAAGFVAYLGPFTVSVQCSALSLQLCCPGQGKSNRIKGCEIPPGSLSTCARGCPGPV